MSGRAILATTKTPDGVPLVLYADTWSKHVLGPRTGHRELRTELDAVLATVAAPDHREADPRDGRERFYKRSRSQPLADGRRILRGGASAYRDGVGVRARTITFRMDAMNIIIDGLAFDRADYDADGDVLYLARGESSPAADAALTPEGHGVRYGADGQVMGVTIVNARWLLERDGHLTITLPHAVRVEARELASALS